jgi:hypothetical protein
VTNTLAFYDKWLIMGLKRQLTIFLQFVIEITTHFLQNLQIGVVSLSLCTWKAFPASCKVTLLLIGPFVNVQNTAPNLFVVGRGGGG